MSKIQIHAGDYPTGVGHFTFRNFTLPNDDSHGICNTICISQVELINKATTDMLLLLEPDEELKKTLMELQKGDILFIARFKDNKRLIGSTDKVTFNKMKKVFASLKDNSSDSPKPQSISESTNLA